MCLAFGWLWLLKWNGPGVGGLKLDLEAGGANGGGEGLSAWPQDAGLALAAVSRGG